ncbi:DNA-binding GntR family transcriptional regulator [Streptomyces sp. 1114.5]|uniref:GntR family transcriptional regulator n=1 Tax=unclassified Streptomyces TaxID=2593676 RepID=UPI000BD16EBF|nr:MULTISPECIES: GntR family transcriptional regulator [unclassified Streptomyces]RKT09296.1 DNA-binding GntR family transcriptional regulator [Streptomyces sp. 1114.5]SOB88694.1 transcriptional regulator, GntR family [Streptomyces sp. 1331.2]
MTGTFDTLAADRNRLERTGIAQRVADILREHITEGRLTPGTRLSEEALGGALAVSRNTLREAFRLLADQRLVVHELNRGVFVRILTPRDVADIYTLRLALEMAGVRALRSAKPEHLSALRAALARAESAEALDDWVAVGTADLHFHQAVAGLAGSDRIDECMARLVAELRLAFAAVPSAHGFHEPFLRRNQTIAGLLESGEIDDAEVELTRYLDDARTVIVQAMTEAGP